MKTNTRKVVQFFGVLSLMFGSAFFLNEPVAAASQVV